MQSLPPAKPCSKCGERKSLTDFPIDKRKRDGHAAECKACRNAASRTYRAPYRKCTECKQRKPVAEFSTQRICTECKSHKACKVCGDRLPLTAFDGYHGLVCRACRKQRDSDRYRADRERILARNAEWRKHNAQPDSPYRIRQRHLQRERKAHIKRVVYEHYGGFVCACCGETEPIFLTIDHINNDGNKHRRETGKVETAYWLYLNGLPDGFRVLCYNCNIGRARNGGVCPHEAQRRKAA
jgi:hypothetical protein